MKYKNAEKECIDKVQSILGFMGIKATFLSRLSDEEILLRESYRMIINITYTSGLIHRVY